MRNLGQEGLVLLEVFIDAKGTVRQVSVKDTAGADFDQAALNAIKASSFQPGTVADRPVAVLLRLPVRFKLR